MAIITALTFLESASTKEGPFTKLTDIVNYPDMGSAPNMLDSTDLSAGKIKTSIKGLQEVPDLSFEANYDAEVYDTINNMDGVRWFNLKLGENGEHGKFQWSGEVSIYLTGGGVDEVRKMNIITSAETEVEFIPAV